MRPVFPGASRAPVFDRDRADIIRLTERLVPRPRRAEVRTGGAVVLAFPAIERQEPVAPQVVSIWDRLRAVVDLAEQAAKDRRARAQDRAIRRARVNPRTATLRRQV